MSDNTTTYKPPRGYPSWSSLSLYHGRLLDGTGCPQAFKLGYIDNEPSIMPDAWLAGIHVHDAIARYGEHCYRAKRKSDFDEAANIAAGYSQSVGKLFLEFADDWRWEWGAVISEDGTPVERRVTGILPGGLEMSGHIDLVQRYDDSADNPFGMEDDPDAGDGALYVITDFKSGVYGTFSDTPPEQLQIYAWLLQQEIPQARQFELRIHALRQFGPQPGPWRIDGDLSHISDRLQGLCDTIAADERHEPVPGENCLSCCYRLACPLRDSETMKAIVDNGPDELLQHLLFHNAQGDALKPLLKAYVEEGIIPEAGGYEFTGRRSSSLQPVAQATLLQDLQRFNVSIYQVLGGPNKQGITKAAKELGDSLGKEFLELFIERPGSLRFGAYKKSSDPEGDDN